MKWKIMGAVLTVALAALLFIQHQSLARYQKENRRLQDTTKQLEQLRDENKRLASLLASTNDLTRLRKEHSELLRLRNEVTSLRNQLRTTTALEQQAAKSAAITPENSATPVLRAVKYEAAIQATVPSGQSLVTGGWQMEPGYRTLAYRRRAVTERSSCKRISSKRQRRYWRSSA
jgi:DNA repair exonuclease SbcCD ATPase subunit